MIHFMKTNLLRGNYENVVRDRISGRYNDESTMFYRGCIFRCLVPFQGTFIYEKKYSKFRKNFIFL